MPSFHLDARGESTSLVDRLALNLHRSSELEIVWRELKRLADLLLPCHSISIYKNYLRGDESFRLMHHAFAGTSMQPWALRQRCTPTRGFLERHRGIRIFQLTQMVPDESVLEASDYYQQVILPEGWGTLVCLVFWRKDDPTYMVVFRTSPEIRRVEPPTLGLFNRLYPQLDVSLRRVESEELRSATWSLLRPVVQSIPLGLAVFDETGRCHFQNDEFIRLLNRWSGNSSDFRDESPVLPPEFREALHAMRVQRSDECRQVVGPHGLRAEISAAVSGRSSTWQVLIRLHLECPAEPERSDRNQLYVLTPSERLVAQAVARGEDNRQIATRLGRSVSTVKSQLSSVFRKLNCSSRAQVIVALHGTDPEREP